PMTRADLQQLSRLRRREARVLLDAGHSAGAYYLVGYAVECALKACIARSTRRYDFPEDLDEAQSSDAPVADRCHRHLRRDRPADRQEPAARRKDSKDWHKRHQPWLRRA